MILYRPENYKDSDELILTVQNDEEWQNFCRKLEADYERGGLSGCSAQRADAIAGMGLGEFSQFWEHTLHDIYKTIRPFWEEMIYPITTLVARIRNMLTILWFEEKEEMERGRQPRVMTHTSDTIFTDEIDAEKVRKKIVELWTKTSVGFQRGAAVQDELMKHQNEWICFHKAFLELGWLKDTRRSSFVAQMQQWFGKTKKGRLLPCQEEGLKRLDSYIKKTPAAEWDIEDDDYRGQIKKLKELIFIYKFLLREFTDEQYRYPSYTY